MKNKSIISLFVFLASLGVTTTSCEDMLTPEMDRYVENFSGRDTVNFYFGIMTNVQELIENNVILGEVRGDLCQPTEYISDTLSVVANFVPTENGENALLNRAAYYKVINQCNFYLAKADSTAQKNSIYYMRKEIAQVQAIRAWTYMQLVQNYGEVPFISKPVDNAGTGWEVNSPEGTATADNLLDKLIGVGLLQAYAYEKSDGFPNYGSFKNGTGSEISHSLTLFPMSVIMADLYLLRGQSTADYEMAARYYYEYLEDAAAVSSNVAAGYEMSMRNGQESYTPSDRQWYADVCSNYNVNSEMVTLIPSASNNFIGKTLTRVAQIYGFDPHSSTSSSVDENQGIDLSGRISVELNEKNRQLAPTPAYVNLCKAQLHVYIDDKNNKVEYQDGLGDCRIDGTIKYIEKDGKRMSFVQKFCPRSYSLESNYYGFEFRYNMPVYRVRQLYLRFAEAINRAGYPRHAFAILRKGLNADRMPLIRYDSLSVDTINKTYKVVPYLYKRGEGNDFIGIDEMRRALNHPEFLDFSDESKWSNDGIHELGCGISGDLDTLYTYERVVAERMLQEAERTGADVQTARKYAHRLLAASTLADGSASGNIDLTDYTELPSDDPQIPEDIAYQINAVETLIADEMAMETAYEGWRYYDLMRMARHKNQDNYGVLPANFGTQWMAWRIARRSLDLKPYELPTQMDASLYGKLLNTSNWFLQNPQY